MTRASLSQESVGEPSIDLPDESLRPNHVAIIMDGNGRWASDRGLPRLCGHRRGADVVRDITTYCREIGVKYLTLYSFSVQNWQRPKQEVGGLMELLEDYCLRERDTLMRNNIRLGTIGRLDRVPKKTRKALEELINETSENDSMVLSLAIDYGAREELLSAIRQIAEDVTEGHLIPDTIDTRCLESRLSTSELPDPDLVIRTSGEVRISNFLLWQVAYAELLFTDVYWPDFNRRDFADALTAYAARQRRFGATTEQLADEFVRSTSQCTLEPNLSDERNPMC